MKGIHYKGIGNTKLTPIDFCGILIFAVKLGVGC